MSVDTEELRIDANTLRNGFAYARDGKIQYWEDWVRLAEQRIRSAAAELDELRARVAELEAADDDVEAAHLASLSKYRQAGRNDERAAHEATKRELEELRVDMAESHDDCPDLDECEQKLVNERARRESAEAALRFEAGMNRIGVDIDAEMHFASYPRETEGTTAWLIERDDAHLCVGNCQLSGAVSWVDFSDALAWRFPTKEAAESIIKERKLAGVHAVEHGWCSAARDQADALDRLRAQLAAEKLSHEVTKLSLHQLNASTGWLLLGCALALEQIRVGVGQLNDNTEAAWYYARTIAERACEDLRELGTEAE